MEYFYVCTVLYLWGAFEVHPWNRQSGDVHGDATVKVERPDDEEEPTADY